jgi:hypothetical protein
MPARSDRVRVVAVALAVLVPAHVTTASADDAKARAQQLFNEGLAAIEKGDPGTGCAKLRESLGLFTVANTLFNVAQCDEQDGKIASALEHWQRGLALLDARDKRAPVAKERIAALEPRVPRLRIVVPVGQGATTVVLDGRELAANVLDAPLLVEPGKHELLIRVPGRQERRHEVDLSAGERTEVVATPGPAATSSAPTASASASAPQPPPTASATVGPLPPDAGSGLRTAGYVSLGIGGAGFIAAAVTGGLIVANDGRIKEGCPQPASCPSDTFALVEKNRGLLPINAAAWGVGAAGIAAGAVMLLVAGRKGGAPTSGMEVVAPLLVGGGGGLSVAGRF